MKRPCVLALLGIACLAPSAAGAQLNSVFHVRTSQEHVIYRSFVKGGVTSFSIWIRNLQGSAPARVSPALNLLPRLDQSPWFLWGGMFDAAYFNNDLRVGTKGHVGVWGTPDPLYAPEYYDAADYGVSGLGFETYRVNTGLYGCDVPTSAYEWRATDDAAPGFYQTCARLGQGGWVTLDWTSQGAWTLESLRVENAFASPGQVGTLAVTATPEPATMALLGTGLAGLGAAARRRRRRGRDEAADPSA